MIDVQAIFRYLEDAVTHYEKTAPTVSAYADDLYRRVGERPADVRLMELCRVRQLREGAEWMQSNFAANFVYKLMDEIGMSTTGHAGF